ncbi:MAG: hypothetical protein HQK66_02265 [Desulfamplus sp.]|nr:hypothetical protein [Desulfamplus sp.]
MQYPLPESIGVPELLVGREKEFATFDKWIHRIPERLSKSRAILARRKSGKTAFLQRIFNRLWSENGKVIPFYINIAEKNIWLADLAINYYRTFVSQYISFMERDEKLVAHPFTLDQIRKYGTLKSISPFVIDVDLIAAAQEKRNYDSMWHTASSAPHRYANTFDCRFLVMIDEFQNTGEYVYTDEHHEFVDKTIPGTWHDLSESKLAPILVTGSYVGWLINIIDTYLEAGRLKRFIMNPYLEPEAGLEAVYRYARAYQEPITNESAVQINRLCMSDPFFISCVIQSEYEGKDLTTQHGVVDTVHHEITDRLSEMSMTWGEYIELSIKRINTINSKHILLHLSKHADREWTPRALKEELGLSIDIQEIKELLRNMVRADLIRDGNSDNRYQGLSDGTLYLILKSRFEEEIAEYQPDLPRTDMKENFHQEIGKLQREKKSLQGMVNHLGGMMAEYQLTCELRSKKSFPLSRYFSGVADDTPWRMQDVRMRVKFSRADGREMELDVLARSHDGRILVVEVKKTRQPSGIALIREFLEKVTAFSVMHPENHIVPAFFSVGGFTGEAREYCREAGVAVATSLTLF